MAAFLLLFLSLIICGLNGARAEKRIALVVGNAAYEHAPPLNNPKNDANAVAALLKRLDFDVLKAVNLTDKGFARTIGEFSQKLDAGSDIALFFYAGHGLQVHGRNYLAPVDAKLDREASLDFEAVRLGTILTLMEQRNGTNLVFLDACRDNPLARNLARNMGTRSTAIGRGLARVETGVGTLIAYATQPGNVAFDGEGTHSPFAAALLKHAETPGLEVEGLMRRIRREVIEATRGAQVPWNHSSLTAPFRFVDPPQQARNSSSNAQQFDPKVMELSFWESIRNEDKAALFEAYLRRYPNGEFSTIAQSKLEEVKKATELPKEQKLASLPEKSEPEPAPKTYQYPSELARALQVELKRVGCDPGEVDGKWGRKSRAALTMFSESSGVKSPDSEPDEAILKQLKGTLGPSCSSTARKKQTQEKKLYWGYSLERQISCCIAYQNKTCRGSYDSRVQPGLRASFRATGCRSANRSECRRLITKMQGTYC